MRGYYKYYPGDPIPYRVTEWRGKYWQHSFFLFERPKQFRKKSEFYYACLDWHEMDIDGHKYWRADVPATDDPEKDFDRVDRVTRYLNLSKMNWKVLTAFQIADADSLPDGAETTYDGRIVLSVWLRANVMQTPEVA